MTTATRTSWPFRTSLPASVEPMPRWLALAGDQRVVIEAECQADALEQADTLHALALSLGQSFALRPLRCTDPEAEGGTIWEHDLIERDGRDLDVRIPHWECRYCGRCERDEADFAEAA